MEDLNVQTIAIPVEEYKDLLRAQTEIAIIYQKNANGDAYGTGTPQEPCCPCGNTGKRTLPFYAMPRNSANR